jgi:oligopeptide transport system permease protein
MSSLTATIPQRRSVWSQLVQRKMALACLVILAFITLGSIFGPMLIPYAHDQTSPDQFAPPSLQHLAGTDLLGRDLLVRILHGARISLAVGLIGTLVSLTVGVVYGMIAGYAGGKTDSAMMRFVDVLYSLPRIIFVIVLVATLDKPIRQLFASAGLEELAASARILLLFIGLGAMEWLTMARIVRGQVLSLKEQQFILAARTLGARAPRILFRHLLPNMGGIIIVYLTLTIPGIILLESLLSFLGLGIQPPQASWGTLLSEGASAINPIRINWWLIVFPGAFMAVTLLSLNILGDHLRDILDPRGLKT